MKAIRTLLTTLTMSALVSSIIPLIMSVFYVAFDDDFKKSHDWNRLFSDFIFIWTICFAFITFGLILVYLKDVCSRR
jgi:hypothetical protein